MTRPLGTGCQDGIDRGEQEGLSSDEQARLQAFERENNHHDAELVTDALAAAVATRGRSRMDGTIFHADHGSEYTSAACMAAASGLGWAAR